MRHAAKRWILLWGAALCICAPSLLASTSPSDERNDQWVYRAIDGEPVAIFMDWTYSKILFRARCSRQTLVIQYFGDNAVNLKKGDDLGLTFETKFYPMDTSYEEPFLNGSLKLTPSISALIASAANIDIEAPNEMGEPWHTGSARALKQVIQLCH